MSDFAAKSTLTAEAAFGRVDHGDIESLGLKGFQTKWYARMRAEERCRERAALVSKRLAGPKAADGDKALQSFQQAADAMIEALPAEMRQSAVYWLIGNVSARETAERVEKLKLAKRSADERLAQAEQQIKSMAKEMAAFVKARHAVQ
jgi:hypothetical protein